MVDSRQARPTIYAVAQLAGVSIATVSRTLKHPDLVTPGTRGRVLAAVEALDYEPDAAARSLADRRHEAVGLIVPELRGSYWVELLAGFEAAASGHQQSVVLVIEAGKRDIGTAARRLARRVDGIALAGPAGLPESAVAKLARQLPLVVIAGSPVRGADTIRSESHSTAMQLTGALLDSGRRKVLFVGDPLVATDVAERYAGFAEAHRIRKLAPPEPVAVPLEAEAGADVAASLLSRTLPGADGLICANDVLALEILGLLTDAGVDIPAQVAVTGWDDIDSARLVRPRLTTVRQPVRELGALAAERLHQRIGAAPAAELPHLIPTAVVVRDSCGTAGQTRSSLSHPTAQGDSR